MKMGENSVTSWTNYPSRYKFFSANLFLSQDIESIDRTTYDLLDMAGDIGGVLEILLFIFKTLSHKFSALRLKAIITNRIFILSLQIL